MFGQVNLIKAVTRSILDVATVFSLVKVKYYDLDDKKISKPRVNY